MTIDLDATFGTIDALQLKGDYEEIQQIIQYASDAILNDGEKLQLIVSANAEARKLVACN